MHNPSEPEARLHAIVHGRVQGVGFRYNTVNKAETLGLTGWVANRWDGTVETIAEGPRKALRQFLSYLRKGPRSALVETVDVDWQTPSGKFDRFRVRYL